MVFEDTLPSVDIENNPKSGRWEVTDDGRVIAFAEYKTRPDKITFTHTEVDPDYEGQGIASRLARAALDDAVARGLRIGIYCPFIRSYVDRHPQYEQYVDTSKHHA
jgi:predicted GNAT family acetyltransferase